MKKTNKTFKRFAAITSASLLAACAVAPVAFNAFAATGNTISFKDEVGVSHTYTGYQIFKGTIEGNELKSVEWAMDATKAAAFLSALKTDTTIGLDFSTCDTAPAVAKVLSGLTDDVEAAQAFAAFAASQKENLLKVNATPAATIDVSTSGDGYYLVIDESVDQGAFSRYLLDSVDADKGIEIAVKSAKPEVVKKVKENVKDDESWNPEDNIYGDQYNDVADYSFSDEVPFKLIATLPSRLHDYDSYYIKFTDTLGKGFVTPTEFTVKIGNTHTETLTLVSGEYTSTDGNIIARTSTVADGGTNIEIEIFDVRKYDTNELKLPNSGKVTVDYDALLDVDAELGKPGNYNDVYLTYANNPNNVGNGSSKPDDTEDTDKDGVVVFTYELDIKKYDGADTDKAYLAGAEFYLKNSNGKFLAIDAAGKYSWVDGEITFDENGVGTMSNSSATKFTSDAEELITIPGLDDGTYSLVEFKAPNGFNRITSDIEMTISASTTNSQNQDAIGPNADISEPADGKGDGRNGDQLTALKIEYGENTGDKAITGDTDKGTVQIDIANNSGAALPGTGGIGTTIFYLGGGAMAAIGGIYLISKRRMRKSEE